MRKLKFFQIRIHATDMHAGNRVRVGDALENERKTKWYVSQLIDGYNNTQNCTAKQRKLTDNCFPLSFTFAFVPLVLQFDSIRFPFENKMIRTHWIITKKSFDRFEIYHYKLPPLNFPVYLNISNRHAITASSRFIFVHCVQNVC